MIEVFGKCILVGEHSVVRGLPALVFPLRSRGLQLRYENAPKGSEFSHLSVSANSPEGNASELEKAFHNALQFALSTFGIPSSKLHAYKFFVESNIPPRAGLGSSATISVAIVNFLAKEGLLSGDLFSHALSIENLFHGTSSGIDVAAALSEKPLWFSRGMPPRELKPKWKPKLFLFDTGLRSSTKKCVEKVVALQKKELDHKMEEAVKLAELSLSSMEETEGVPLLAKAMEKAEECFQEWDLIPTPVRTQIKQWKKQGAIAVKPTGSGDGGFLLTLWRDVPGIKEGIPV